MNTIYSQVLRCCKSYVEQNLQSLRSENRQSTETQLQEDDLQIHQPHVLRESERKIYERVHSVIKEEEPLVS